MNRPARILLAITGTGIGGTEKVISFLARNLPPDRFTPVVCSVKPLGVTARELSAAGIESFSLDFDPPCRAAGMATSLLLVPILAREVRRRNIHLVHSFLFLANMVGRLASRRAGVPHISSIRADIRVNSFEHRLERLTSRMADSYLVPSEAVATSTVELTGIPREKIVVIPNAVDQPPPSAGCLKRLLGLGEGLKLAGFVGRLHRQKGVDNLLRAWARISPDVRPLLVIVGDGPERGALEEESLRLGFGKDAVLFTGWIPGIRDILADLDLFILPSRYEGLPNGVLEAMAAGVPVVASAVGGVPELIRDGETGFLAPPDDSRALAAVLAKALADPAASRRAGERALARVLEHHRPQQVLGQFQDLYSRILC